MLEIVRTNIRLHMQCTHILLWVDLANIDIYDLDRGAIHGGLRRTKSDGCETLELCMCLHQVEFYFMGRVGVYA